MLQVSRLNKVAHSFQHLIQPPFTPDTELSAHSDVLEVSVVARSHEKWGERPMAFVKLHPERAGQWRGRTEEFSDNLKKHARKRLPGFACPEWVEVVDDLPVRDLPAQFLLTLTWWTENIYWQDSEDRFA